jgi:8-oxo-dGTP pyrophosphatase MutT (NUDIX family)
VSSLTTRYAFGRALRDRIERNLTDFAAQAVDDPDLRRAAVAIVVVENAADSAASILLTRRGGDLRRHGGQYALPGGRVDAGETVIQAALRELHEELNLDVPADAVLGRLDDYPTRSGFRIAPIVVWGGDTTALAPDPVEVQKVFWIPLTDLDSPAIPRLEAAHGDGHPVLSAPLETIGHPVYAPTAAMLYQFREVALHGRATRVAHFDQPRFAWS